MIASLFVHYLQNVWNSTYASCVGNGPESIVEIIAGVVVWNRWLGPRYHRWHEATIKKHMHAVLDERAGDSK
jgi:hypothetical protein